MFKKSLVVIALLIACMLVSGVSYADTAIEKLGRGAANVFTCPLEIMENMQKVDKASGPFAGWTWGLIQGVFMTGVRFAVGAYEIVTFPIPIPKDYGPILTDPEYFWEDSAM